MTGNRGNDYLVGLVQELCKLPKETEWLEFKLNMRTPKGIGEYISALSNAATGLDHRFSRTQTYEVFKTSVVFVHMRPTPHRRD